MRKKSHRTSKRWSLLPLALVLAFVVAACSPDEEPATEPEATPAEEPDESATEEPDEAAEISGEITMARASWDTEYVIAEIYYQLLGELGYDVEHPENNELGAELFYQALDQGDVDFWANGWFPLHDPFLENTTSVEQVGMMIPAGGFNGYLIDKATADEYDITSFEQIAEDPEINALFDFTGDDRADLVGCDAGWGCFEAIEQHLTETGHDATIEHVSAQYSVLMTDLLARYDRGEPVLFYTWTPNWTVGALVPGEDVVWIEAPTHPHGNDPIDGVEGCVTDPCHTGWNADDIRVAANADFLADNPAAATLFERVELPLGAIAEQNLRMQDGESSQADIERHAQEWIEANRTLVDEWLEAARAAA
ncbi:MAG: glycine betaine/L-proline ABC transporter substrate-binding protein ProX [Nitriliruptoraceae bacterium]